MAMKMVNGKINTGIAVQSVRKFSDILSNKEHAEESAYIRRVERERREADLRASVEEILAREDHDDQKQTLIKAVDKKQPEGLLQYFGLHDWRVALPVALTIGGPMIQFEYIIVDHKFYILAAFTMFWHAFALVFLPIHAEVFGGDADRVTKIYEQAEAASMADVKLSIEENEKFLSVGENMKQIYALRDDVYAAQAEALNLAEQHEVRRAFVQKLDALVALEESANTAIRQDMVNSVKASVSKSFHSDKKVQDKALTEAIAALSGGKRSGDVVGEVFKSSIVNYRNTAGDSSSSSSQIVAKLQKDIDELCKTTVQTSQGGNVYETHKVGGVGAF